MELVHTFTVAAPAARIYAHLMDPRSYLGLSPLLVEVRDIHRADDTVSYVAVERFTFGPFHWNNPIRVTMTGEALGRAVVSAVRSPGFVTLTSRVVLSPQVSGTLVVETIRLAAPAPLRRFVVGQARSVQLHRASELTRRMAAA
ncbi:SRPBCC family protein [Actinoplanes oblitus]|uniref:SRPBCC family protein n=1 Tax=Actinoplanes oblitus TaxID=3040509 RepID=A0ABY8WBY1_9ACTN|nr:SRPBCC family protein [Actinoplanes oblitus]WIM95168.1 SRPBCC family protein [Actinoplanes oblitus]